MTGTQDTWPAGATWVFQGTVAEDATVGTHVCTLTVSPGAGNEMELIGGEIIVGNTATNQSPRVIVDDGTNVLIDLMNANGLNNATANVRFPFPEQGNQALSAIATDIDFWSPAKGLIISGTMRIVLNVSTAAVSVTQTFAIVCRIKGAMPTATLADSVGTPVLTTNTNAVF